MRATKALLVAIAGAGVACASGCSLLAPQPDRTQFFVLTPMESPGSSAAASAPAGLVIGLGPVQFPDYLDRATIVTRESGNRLRFADLERWAEPLPRNFVRVLAQNLTELLGTQKVVPYPWFGTVAFDYQVPIEVLRFEGDESGTVRLDARWGIKNTKSKSFVMSTESRVVEHAARPGVEGDVAAMSQAVAKLSAEIAAEVGRLARH